MKNRKTNPLIIGLTEELGRLSYENEARIWKELSERLAKSSRRMVVTNVGKISENTKAKDQVAVPGKVLGFGSLDHPVAVAGLGFSSTAREKILKAGGECMGLLDLAKRNPTGSNVKIIV